MSLPYHEKGYRILRVGETIQRGDFEPAGIEWIPVSESRIGTEVLGPRWSGADEQELIMRPRLRAPSNAKVQRLAASGLQVNRGHRPIERIYARDNHAP